MAISAETPAYRDGSEEAVWAIRSEVSRAQETAITSEIVNLMLGQAKFEIQRQLESGSDRTLIGDRLHGSLVADLGDVPSEAEPWLKEKKEAAGRRASERLNFNIPAKEVASVGSALRSGPSSTARLRKHAAAQIGLVV